MWSRILWDKHFITACFPLKALSRILYRVRKMLCLRRKTQSIRYKLGKCSPNQFFYINSEFSKRLVYENGITTKYLFRAVYLDLWWEIILLYFYFIWKYNVMISLTLRNSIRSPIRTHFSAQCTVHCSLRIEQAHRFSTKNLLPFIVLQLKLFYSDFY